MSIDLAFASPRPAPNPIVRPRLLRLSNKADRDEVEALLGDAAVDVHETIQSQLRDLVQTRQPGRALSSGGRTHEILRLLDGRTLTEYGTWVYYPWSRRLVHVLDAADFAELRARRNLHLLSAEQQDQLSTKRIGLVGLAAGMGVALALALERGCGELRLADHRKLKVSNFNHPGGRMHDIDLPWVAIAAREIAELDPYLPVTCFFEGVSEQVMAGFFSHGGGLDLVINESVGPNPKVLLRECARDMRVPVLTQTLDRGLLDVERFDLEPNRDLFSGFVGDVHSPQPCSTVALGCGVVSEIARSILLGEIASSGRFGVDLFRLASDASAGEDTRA